MRSHSFIRNNSHDHKPSILVHRCPPRCCPSISRTYLWLCPSMAAPNAELWAEIIERIHTTFTQACLKYECVSIGNVTVCALLLVTWSWVRGSATDEYCCSSWDFCNRWHNHSTCYCSTITATITSTGTYEIVADAFVITSHIIRHWTIKTKNQVSTGPIDRN
jgi:hypothetical protein